MDDNKQKACAVMEFVEIMIGAYEAGFVDSHTPTLAQVHQVARNHVKDNYGVETEPLDVDLRERLTIGA